MGIGILHWGDMKVWWTVWWGMEPEVYWSAPAALLVRFRGDLLGEALSVRQEADIKYYILAVLCSLKTEKKNMMYIIWQMGTKMNILMALRVSWGIQLMSTSFIPAVPFSIFTGILFLCKSHEINHSLSRMRRKKKVFIFIGNTKGNCTAVSTQHRVKTKTYRPGLQNLVHPKDHQGHQSPQEHVHEHPANKIIFIYLRMWTDIFLSLSCAMF